MEKLDRRGKGVLVGASLVVLASAVLVGAGSFGIIPPARVMADSVVSPDSDASPAHIDIVFAIDCSGSMGPVIETAKRKVWTIVNQIAKAKPAPVLRIGLIGYGNGEATHRMFPLSDDLDTVYKNLMTFRDEGWGTEYVGLAVHKATEEMEWSKGSMGLKVIYVLGNETARQGPLDYAKSTPAAVLRNIIVNAIYCDAHRGGSSRVNAMPQSSNANRTPKSAAGKPQHNTPAQPQAVQSHIAAPVASPEPGSEQFTWLEMAQLGRGQFMVIEGDGGTVNIATPYDEELVRLGNELNGTYIPYGRAGASGVANQKAQDANSAAVGGVGSLAARSNAKAAAQYNNRGWDLVDASRDKGFDWAKIKPEELPEPMRTMTIEERKAYVAGREQERSSLQTKIRLLGEKRDAYIQQEIKKQGVDTSNSFDDSVRRSITRQAEAKGFKF